MNEKILKYLIYIWGAISLYAFIAIRFEPLFNGVLKENVVEGYWDKTKYGELYYFSMIRHFREEGLPPAQGKFEHSEKQSSVEDCEILVFGDSYFEFSRHKQFPEKLADDFDKKVHYVNHDFPLQYLAENNYKGSTPKLVLFERVERFIPVAFKEQHIIPEEPVVQSDAFQPLKYIREKLFYHSSEELYDAMLKRSYLSTGIYSLFVTWKFDLYGNMSGKTPAYLKDGSNSWLFYHDQVNETRTSFYYQHTDEQIDSICDHMDNLSKQLLEEYNMQLLFLPLPAKYTLYHGLINDDPYNEFLPRLYEGLQERGVKYIDVFDKYLESDTLLFYRTDSHWNQKGIDMAYKETLQFINSDSILNTFL